MDLIQWDKSALANLMGNTNGNTDWFFGYLNTDQLVPLMDSPTSLAAYQHFAKHCISARLLSMRSINGTTIEKFANIIYSDAGRIFHHRGTLDVPNTNIKRVIPTNCYFEGITDAEWNSRNNPFYLSSILNCDLKTLFVSVPRTAKYVIEFDTPTNITNISFAHSSAVQTRASSLTLEYKTENSADWITLPSRSLSNAITSLQTFSLIIPSALSIRIGIESGSAGTLWEFDTIYFSSTDDVPKVDEEVKSLVMIPVPNAGHITPPIWGSGNVRVFAYDVSELKMNRLTTDRFTELGAIMSRLEAKAVVL